MAREQFGNLTYVRGLKPEFTSGLRLKPWENRTRGENGQKVVQSREVVSVLGSLTREGRVQGPFKIIPVSTQQKPLLTRDGLRALLGTFQKLPTESGEKMFLTNKEASDDAYYVHLQTGFSVGLNGQIDGHLNRLLLEGVQPTSFGSFSLDGASVQIEEAEGLELSKEQATRLRWSVSRGVRHDLWRIPSGAAVLVRDVNGIIFRIVAEGNDVRIVDATKYEKVFEDLEDKRAQRNAAVKAARNSTGT